MERWLRAKYQPAIGLGKDGSRITACEEHHKLSKEAAREGMVLLKNEENVLPLRKGSRVALFGKASVDYVKGGGGSGDVTVSYTRNLIDGFESIGDCVHMYPELNSFYQKEVKRQYEAGVAAGMTKEPILPEEMYRSARNYADIAIISICRFSGEGWDRKSELDSGSDLQTGQPENEEQERFERGDFYLTQNEELLVEKVKEYFSRIVVVLNVGGIVDTSWFAQDTAIQSVLMAWQGGMEGGTAAAELLCGVANPSGKLADTFAARLTDYPSSYNFHESEDYVDYTEDVYVGYRYFETIPNVGQKVNYPFGFGLSYTTFASRVLEAKMPETMTIDKNSDFSDLQICFRVEVQNTGDMAGREVIQVYGSAEAPILGKPKKNLLAFAKTRLLQSGETQVLSLKVALRDMASYDDLGKIKKSAYILEQGEYTFYIGNSVRSVTEACHFTLPDHVVTEQLSQQIVPTSLAERMTADGSMEKLPQMDPIDTDACEIMEMDKVAVDGLTPAFRAVDGVLLWSWKYKAGIRPFSEVAEGKMSVEDFLAQMTDEEIAHLLGGQPNTSVSNTFGIGNMPEYGIPNITTADGPAGLRIEPWCGVNTTAWPCATLLASTWDTELNFRVGEAGAKEVRENNIGVWLTPAVNIHRSPLCGRNFEYYSEDPLLAGKMAAAMVSGIQSQHIAATVKHFAFNNKETNRKNSDSRVSERAAREIYLKAFEIIVKEAKPWCIMTAYNIVNGCRASENKSLIQGILRGEWGFDGMVTTDWWTFGEHYKEVKAGNDLKMACGFPKRLLMAMEEGVLERKEMEACAANILRLILKID